MKKAYNLTGPILSAATNSVRRTGIFISALRQRRPRSYLGRTGWGGEEEITLFVKQEKKMILKKKMED